MPDTILVIAEQREGKLNRVSWETIAAGQAIAAATGWTLEAATVGASPAAIAAEVASKKMAKVYAVESPKLEPYTPDAFAAGLKQFIASKQPKLVLMPHTYQVRDFVPKLATAMGRSVISDCVGFKHENGNHKMVVGNTPQSHQDMPFASSIIYEELTSGVRKEDRILAWKSRTSISPSMPGMTRSTRMTVGVTSIAV